MLSRRFEQVFLLARRRFHASPLFSQNDLPSNLNKEPSELAKSSLPIEKKSLTRGMALNKYEKDFMIYPEHSDTDDYESIKNYRDKLASDFNKALATADLKDTSLFSPQYLQVLQKNEVFATFIPTEFGGKGFCQKDMVMVTETLGTDDLSLFVTFNQAQSAAALISVFGTEEQKAKYLPEIAAFKCKPAICIYDEQTADGLITEVHSVRGHPAKLNGAKMNVINAHTADIFLVFAKRNVGEQREETCYIIDRNDLGVGGSINIQERIKTQGLNALHISKVNFNDVNVSEDNILGAAIDSAEDMLDELRMNGKTFYGSAVVGFLKKVTKQLCEYANCRMEGNLRLADLHPVQSAATNLAIGVYVLESMVYYIAGLVDEDLFLQNDLENSIIQKFSNKLLRQAIVSILDVAGLSATNEDFPFDKSIRDAITLTSMTESDLKLVRRVALPAIESFIKEHGSLSTFMAKFTVEKLFRGDFREKELFKNPKLTHFIAEDVHPSLQVSARALEQSMSRVKQAIDHMLTDRGLYIKEDYFALSKLSLCLVNNMAMTATIARASRSYSIGLRSAEMEMHWTNYFCEMAGKENEEFLLETINHFGLMAITPRLTLVGKTVLENNGYFLENPMERNW